MSIDWTKPLELLDGTPVRLQTNEEMAGFYGGTNPDRDGEYWIIGMNGEDLGEDFGEDSCVPPDGGGIVRNVALLPDPATIIRDLLAHAVYDREKSDECAAAVAAAEAFLGQS